VNQVRRPIIAALALFTTAIALDRLGVGTGEDAIAGHAYFIALAAVIAPLLAPGVRRGTWWAMPVVTTTALIGYSALFDVGFFGQSDVHLAMTELTFVTLAAWLGRRVAIGLDRVDDLLAAAAFGDSPALDLEGPTAANEIHTEIARGRRHDRPLSVTVLTPTAEGLEAALTSASVEVDRSVRTRFLFGSLAKTIAGELRRSDLLFEHRPSGRLIVLSPETDTEGTELLVRRILDAAARTGIETQAGTASFPDDGVGFETLVSHAEAALTAETEAAPHLRAVDQADIA